MSYFGKVEFILAAVTLENLSLVLVSVEIKRSSMARGHQKFQSQQKNLKKQEEMKKSKGSDQKAAAIKALTHKCTVCMALMPDPKTYKQHFQSKHPKAVLPPELVDVQA
uniref:Bm4970 n=2 Tax=Brugia malayi TaxID=6279 RepID=A0A0H5S2L5_BRUMA|nr:Bm4970 [Brugia malayi]